MKLDRDMSAVEATKAVESHPSFLPQLKQYVELARSGQMFASTEISLADQEEMRRTILERWQPVIDRLDVPPAGGVS